MGWINSSATKEKCYRSEEDPYKCYGSEVDSVKCYGSEEDQVKGYTREVDPTNATEVRWIQSCAMEAMSIQ